MKFYPRTAFVRSAIVVGLVIGISQALTLWFFARNAYLPGIREYARLTVLQAELAFDDSRAAADADLAHRLGNATGIAVAIPEKLHDGTMRKIDKLSLNFWAAGNLTERAEGTLSLMERQRTRVWCKKSYAEIEKGLQTQASSVLA